MEQSSSCIEHLTRILAADLGPRAGETAARLIRDFGSLPAVLEGSSRRISRVAGIEAGGGAIEAFRAAMDHALSVRLADRPVLGNWKALLQYLHADMGHRRTERVRLLHLSSGNALIRDEVISNGTIDQATVHIREVISSALEVGSAALILVHNHPTGDLSPSRSDVGLTRAIIDAGKPLNIRVHDHIIVGSSGHVSMRARGLI